MYLISVAEIIKNLIGATHIFLRNEKCLGFFTIDLRAFWQSFWCAVILLPIYLIMVFTNRYFSESMNASAYDNVFRLLSVEIIAYIISWVLWPVAMLYVVKMIDRKNNYFSYIILYNWSAAPMLALGFIVTILEYMNIFSLELIAAISIGFLIWRFIIHIFIFKITMKVSVIKAIPFIFADFFIGQMILITKYNMQFGT